MTSGHGVSAYFQIMAYLPNIPRHSMRVQPLVIQKVTFNINPNIAYRINQQFSIGAGINAVYGAAELNRFAGYNLNGLPERY